jgi:GT2 family glycosyltransferase
VSRQTPEAPVATVMIATHNRRQEVSRAIASALDQSAAVEVVVTDDASDDGSADHIAASFPAVRLVRSEQRIGSLRHRNAMAAIARAPILISLDDDAELASSRTVEQVVGEFDDERIAAVGIPFFDGPRPTRLEHRAPPGDGVVVTDYFLGCCPALRRDRFLAVGGYDVGLHHSGEEPDLCARWLRQGWVVRLGSSDLAVHHVSARRAGDFAVRYATRNEWRNAWRHVPTRCLARELTRLAATAAGRAVVRRRPRAVLAGLSDALRDRPDREPLPTDLYRVWVQLAGERRRRSPKTRLSEIEHRLPVG